MEDMVICRWVRIYEHANGYYRNRASKWHYPYWGSTSEEYMACEARIPHKNDSPQEYDNYDWMLESIEVEYDEGQPDCGNCLRRLNSGKW